MESQGCITRWSFSPWSWTTPHRQRQFLTAHLALHCCRSPRVLFSLSRDPDSFSGHASMQSTTFPSQGQAEMSFGSGGYENLMHRMEAQEYCLWPRISENTATLRIREMEAGHRHALFSQDQQFQAAVRERQRRARQAVNDAILECSARYQQSMTHEIQFFHLHHDGHMLKERSLMKLEYRPTKLFRIKDGLSKVWLLLANFARHPTSRAHTQLSRTSTSTTNAQKCGRCASRFCCSSGTCASSRLPPCQHSVAHL